MFKLNIFQKKKEKYLNLEKKCYCCKNDFSISELVKDNLYFHGDKSICPDCIFHLKLIRDEYIKMFGRVSSSDLLFLNTNLNTIIKKTMRVKNNLDKY